MFKSDLQISSESTAMTRDENLAVSDQGIRHDLNYYVAHKELRVI